MNADDRKEGWLADCCRRIALGEKAAFHELGRYLEPLGACFLKGAGVGLHGEDAARAASSWIIEICTRAGTATVPVQNWIDAELEQCVCRDYFDYVDRLQRRIYCEMPPLPAGVSVAARIRPAQRLTGDLVFTKAVSGSVLFVGGDVTTHGMAAAVFGALLYPWLDRFATCKTLAEMAVALNREIFPLAFGRRNLAASLVRWSPCEGLIEVLNCGTPPAILLRDGVATDTPVGGLGLGMLPEPTFEVWRGDLADGDVLILYSDGIIDQVGDGGQFGIEGMKQVVESLAGCTPDEIVDGVLRALDNFVGGKPQNDDQLIMAIQFVSPKQIAA